MRIDVDFADFGIDIIAPEQFQLEYPARAFVDGLAKMNVSRRELEALRMMIDQALNTSAEELGDVE